MLNLVLFLPYIHSGLGIAKANSLILARKIQRVHIVKHNNEKNNYEP